MKEILKTKTFLQSSITSSATIINGLLGLLFYIYLARILGPASFGIFSISVMSITLIADVANVGTDTGIVRFVGKYLKEDKEKALQFLKLGLKIKITVGILVIIIGWILIPFIATSIFQKEELIEPLKFSLIGAFGALIFSFAMSAIQATQKFVVWGFLNILLNSLRLVSIIVLSLTLILNLNSALISYIIFPFIGFILSFVFLPKYLKVKNEFSVSREFFHYNKWIAVFTLIAAISSRLDIYISTRFLSLTEIGIYSVATNLTSVIPQIVFGIATVVAPKLASFDSSKKVVNYLKKIQFFVLGMATLGLFLSIPLAYIFIPIFYGQTYMASFLPFCILLIAQLIFLISIPAHTSVIYYFSYPKLFVGVSLIHLVIVLVLGSILISQFGYLGAAVTVLIGSISNLIIPGFWVLRKLKK